MPAFPILVLETSTPQASLVLARDAEARESAHFASDRNHNALLFGPLETLLAPLAPGDLRAVLIGTGPGSYSGTRVGIAAAQGVALVHGCHAIGIPSLVATATARESTEALAVGDARRGSWWTARIRDGVLLEEPVLADKDTFLATVRAAIEAGQALFTFDPPARLGLPEDLAAAVRPESPDASRLLDAWLSWSDELRATYAELPPQPVYLKPPHVTEAKPGHPLLRKP